MSFFFSPPHTHHTRSFATESRFIELKIHRAGTFDFEFDCTVLNKKETYDVNVSFVCVVCVCVCVCVKNCSSLVFIWFTFMSCTPLSHFPHFFPFPLQGSFIIAPELLLCGQSIPLQALSVQTILVPALGPIDEWKPRLRVAAESGYNAVHFSPVQVRECINEKPMNIFICVCVCA